MQALEFTMDTLLTDALAHLWATVRKLGEESIKNVDNKNSLIQLMDNYRKLMPEIKESIISEQKSMEILKEVQYIIN